MSIKLTRRLAAELMDRGETSIRIKPASLEEAEKAITRDDVRRLIKSGAVYAIAGKKTMSFHAMVTHKKREQGRRRGPGRRRGTAKARGGVDYKKMIRGQRRVLAALKKEKVLENEKFKEYYRLVKGGLFSSKATLLNRIKSDGIAIPDEKFEKLRHI
jgi:large subunit ribosomal protein L19e